MRAWLRLIALRAISVSQIAQMNVDTHAINTVQSTSFLCIGCRGLDRVDPDIAAVNRLGPHATLSIAWTISLIVCIGFIGSSLDPEATRRPWPDEPSKVRSLTILKPGVTATSRDPPGASLPLPAAPLTLLQ